MNRLLLLGLWLVCQLAHVAASLWMLVCIAWHPRSHRAWIIAGAYDQLANAVTGGDMDEKISSRANRARGEGRRWGCLLCRLLDALDPDHCRRSAGT